MKKITAVKLSIAVVLLTFLFACQNQKMRIHNFVTEFCFIFRIIEF